MEIGNKVIMKATFEKLEEKKGGYGHQELSEIVSEFVDELVEEKHFIDVSKQWGRLRNLDVERLG